MTLLHPRSALAASLLVLSASGCAHAWFTPTGNAYAPRPDDCDIEVFSTGTPTAAYEELGLLEGEGDLWKANMSDLLPELKKEACRAGGDAIILQAGQRYATGEDGDDKLYASATVIRFIRD